jgi:hypothetical protein
MAFALHLDTTRNHLGNVALMYDELPEIKDQFETGFENCSIASCTDDCVWPGDANNDGIANNLDVLYLGLAYSGSGPERDGPLSWAPHNASDWPVEFINGLNAKHADMNGNGSIDIEKDVDILQTHYRLTHGGYQGAFHCTEGNEIIVEGGFEEFDPNSLDTRTFVTLNAAAVDSLLGIAFTVVFDTFFFHDVLPFSAPFDFNGGYAFDHLGPGIFDFAAVALDGSIVPFDEDTRLLSFIMPIFNRDLVIGKHDTAEFCIANITGILKDGTELPMGSNKIYFVFLDENVTAVGEGSQLSISVYPNPASGKFILELPQDLIGSQFDLYSTEGKRLQAGIIETTLSELSAPEGVYHLVVINGSSRVVKKVVMIE